MAFLDFRVKFTTTVTALASAFKQPELRGPELARDGAPAELKQ